MAGNVCEQTGTEAIERLWTVQDVAEYLQVSVRKVWRMHSMRTMPGPVAVGGRSKRWNPSVIREWVQQGCPEPTVCKEVV